MREGENGEVRLGLPPVKREKESERGVRKEVSLVLLKWERGRRE